MPSTPDSLRFVPEDFPEKKTHSLLLFVGAILVGLVTGFVGAAFLWLLRWGNAQREAFILALGAWPPVLGWLALAFSVAGLAAFAAWLVVRFAPNAAGSGVPYVEKILRGTDQPNHLHVLPVKFFGGLIALSSGMVLGREGPMVQMGAVIGEKIGRLIPGGIRDSARTLMTAGAGAGLATAFNAPVGGTVFILEEVQRRVTPLSFVLAGTAAVSSVFVQRGIFGMAQDFQVPDVPAPSADAIGVFFLFGLLVGLIGVVYNRVMIGMLDLSDRLHRIPAPLRAAVAGFIVGTVGWLAPGWIGGGDDIVQSVLNGSLSIFIALAAVRFFLGPLSYAAGTPGGLFAPVIALGALLGAAFGDYHQSFFPEGPSGLAFVIAGMVALFTSTIRAPITGMVICLEMTGSYSLFFPLLATSLGAYLMPSLLKSSPIYDQLAERAARR